MEPPEPILLAVSIESIQTEPYLGPDMRMAKSANICGESKDRDVCFNIKSGLLNSDSLHRCELLQKHGFTVVEVPNDWRYAYNGPGGWQEIVIQQAMKQVAENYEETEGVKAMGGYDAELAQAVLLELNKSFPYAITDAKLKHSLNPEPSDDSLLTALDALHLEGLVIGKGLREHSSSDHKLVAMANIQITAGGRKSLSGQTQQTLASGAVIHGDQIINYGQAAALGRGATGTINHHQQWAETGGHINLHALAAELERVISHLQRSAISRSDFQQIGLLAEAEEQAEKQDGAKVMETLSRAGKGLLDFAKDVGSDLAAKVIAKSMGLEP
jgi:hypothetical protein